MSKHLQQLDVVTQKQARGAIAAVPTVSLNANMAFVLLLVLVIIPTSGVALIA